MDAVRAAHDCTSSIINRRPARGDILLFPPVAASSAAGGGRRAADPPGLLRTPCISGCHLMRAAPRQRRVRVASPFTAPRRPSSGWPVNVQEHSSIWSPTGARLDPSFHPCGILLPSHLCLSLFLSPTATTRMPPSPQARLSHRCFYV